MEITQRLVSPGQAAEVQRREEGISGQRRLTCPLTASDLPSLAASCRVFGVFRSFYNRNFVPKCQTSFDAGSILCVWPSIYHGMVSSPFVALSCRAGATCGPPRVKGLCCIGPGSWVLIWSNGVFLAFLKKGHPATREITSPFSGQGPHSQTSILAEWGRTQRWNQLGLRSGLPLIVWCI